MFVMRSGERTIMSSECVRDWYPSKRLQIVQGYRLMETGLTRQACDRLESTSGDSSPKKAAGRGVYNCHDTEKQRFGVHSKMGSF